MTPLMLAKENPEWQKKLQATQENRGLNTCGTRYCPEIFLS